MQTSGNTVLVTGGTAGIGYALASCFRRAGNEVIITGRDQGRLDAAAGRLGGVRTIIADMGDPSAVAKLASETQEANIVVNNAGIQINATDAKPYPTVGDIQREVATNLTGPMLLVSHVLPALLEKPEAAIVNVSSGLALVPKQDAPVYCGTKAGLHIYSKALRWQLEHTAVRVFEIIPSLVDTAMTHGRGTGKITADELADEFWRDFARERFESRIGKVKLLARINRFLPRVAESIMRGN